MKKYILLFLTFFLKNNLFSASIPAVPNPNIGVLMSENSLCTITAINVNQNRIYVTAAHCIGSCTYDGVFNLFPNFSASAHFTSGYTAPVTSVNIPNANICDLVNLRTENDYAFLTLGNGNGLQQPNGLTANAGTCNLPVNLKGVPGSFWNDYNFNIFRVQQKYSNYVESARAGFNLTYHNVTANNATTLRVNQLDGETGQSGGALVDIANNLCGILSSGIDKETTYYVSKNQILNTQNNIQANTIRIPALLQGNFNAPNPMPIVIFQ